MWIIRGSILAKEVNIELYVNNVRCTYQCRHFDDLFFQFLLGRLLFWHKWFTLIEMTSNSCRCFPDQRKSANDCIEFILPKNHWSKAINTFKKCCHKKDFSDYWMRVLKIIREKPVFERKIKYNVGNEMALYLLFI